MTKKQLSELEMLLEEASDKVFNIHCDYFHKQKLGTSNMWLRTYDKLNEALMQIKIHKEIFLNNEAE